MSSVYTPAKPLTFEEYLAYDDGSGRRYELLDTGELIELPGENNLNIELALALFEYLKQFVYWRLLRLNSTAIQVTPMAVTLANGQEKPVRRQSRIPDLMVLTPEGRAQIYNDYNALSLDHHNPVLVVECVSESNADEDYIDKRAQYEARKIPEYWIVDRHRQQVTVLTLAGDYYVEACYQGDTAIQSAAFPKATLTAKKIFSEEDL
ncbi:Uma2 family endonuclease [soil metagenome]|uniref:Uma2 family endonuclease n=1 Tax=Leptolyngbya sp. BC1307 TaxID=2029589 RepID=UPI000EFCEBA6|nr:Uma2 family endonuclease [Leptolyngbya sp. BC1307]